MTCCGPCLTLFPLFWLVLVSKPSRYEKSVDLDAFCSIPLSAFKHHRCVWQVVCVMKLLCSTTTSPVDTTPGAFRVASSHQLSKTSSQNVSIMRSLIYDDFRGDEVNLCNLKLRWSSFGYFLSVSIPYELRILSLWMTEVLWVERCDEKMSWNFFGQLRSLRWRLRRTMDWQWCVSQSNWQFSGKFCFPSPKKCVEFLV